VARELTVPYFRDRGYGMEFWLVLVTLLLLAEFLRRTLA
jgi:hypothetical protein